jgi:hypothetical protein
MGKVEDDIKNQLQLLAGEFGPAQIISAKVLSVNIDEDTIAVAVDGGLEIDDVRLKSIIKAGNKLVLRPTVNSTVLIGRIENSDEWVMISPDEIDSMKLIIGDVAFEINENGFLVKKDDKSLKDLLVLLIEAVEKIVVLEGNNPDYEKLIEAKSITNNLLV